MASYLGHITNVAQLVNGHNVHPDVADMQGNTALMYATVSIFYNGYGPSFAQNLTPASLQNLCLEVSNVRAILNIPIYRANY